MPPLLIDGFDPQTLGFKIGRVEGHRAAPERIYPLNELPGADGAILLSEDGVVKARRITLQAYQRGPDLPTLLANQDELLWRLWGRDVELIFGDRADRFIRGRAEPFEFPLIQPDLVQTAHHVRITFLCKDPRYYATALSSVAIGGAATPIPLGSAPSHPLITLNGAATGPQLVYRDAAGTERLRMDFGGTSIGSGASLVIDCDPEAMTITDGAGANRADALKLGRFPRFDPRDAYGLGGPWPTLEVSSGSGVVSYRKAWL